MDIKFENIIERDPITVNFEDISSYLFGKTILITGAAGTIGSELVKKILEFNPHQIVLVDQDENGMFFLEFELKSRNIVSNIVSICSSNRIEAIFKKYKPQIVFHAAAHKHVCLGESNVNQMIYNNVIGTKIIADIAVDYKCESFVLISTDKAVNPTCIMGASKRIAEYYIQFLAKNQTDTIFTTVRFGNVLGSSGSVFHVFKKQLETGVPITISDKDASRFFITINEAICFVLQSIVFKISGGIFIFNMGDPIKIIDLVQMIINKYGLKNISFNFFGLRSGEKINEELFFYDEIKFKTSHDKIEVIRETYAPENIKYEIEELRMMSEFAEPDEIRQKLISLIPSSRL